jgi:hypothetical protein
LIKRQKRAAQLAAQLVEVGPFSSLQAAGEDLFYFALFFVRSR